ncbi:YcxB family protein [Terrisporobacter glycolicus]|uniref:YcxB-like C-terminal domain-containing protein n=1 Tax=Terrisporobacter glycolicus ATCC 14880 = DSM 1288 TaxID=1121315 RepID=A0ABZ2EU85_9FIRM|nr:YcxB family protein [Terrisporobacter glycolicus]
MIVVILVTILKIEMKFKKVIKTDKTGLWDSQEVLDFYEDFLIVKSKVFEGEIKVKYAQFYEVFESKDYFITYLNDNKASLIRKKDMESEVIHSLRSLYIKNLTNKYKSVNI